MSRTVYATMYLVDPSASAEVQVQRTTRYQVIILRALGHSRMTTHRYKMGPLSISGIQNQRAILNIGLQSTTRRSVLSIDQDELDPSQVWEMQNPDLRKNQLSHVRA